MIDQVVMESEKMRNSEVAEMAEKKDIKAIETYDVRGQHGPFLSTVLLANWTMVIGLLNEGVLAGLTQKATMKAVASPSMIKAVSDALLKK